MRYVAHPNVVARRLDDATVLVHLDTSRIFTLNPTGARIWELLTGDTHDLDVAALERLLHDEYHVGDDEQLHGEVTALLRQLEEEQLVVDADANLAC
jgi:hypothetical protein